MKLFDLDASAWETWVQALPARPQGVARSFPPNLLYRLGRHRVRIVSYNDDGTVTVNVSGDYNRVLFARNVFGIDPHGLVECDGPEPEEAIGDTAAEMGYTEEEIRTVLIPLARRVGGGNP